MRRRGFTLVEIMVVVMIIGVIMMIAVPGWVRIRQKSQHTACLDNMRVIRDSKQQWGLDNNQAQSSTPAEGDLAPIYMKKFPTCPQNGTFTIGSLDQDVECSEHGKLE